MRYYSPSTGGFYDDAFAAPAIPGDALPETAWVQQFDYLMSGGEIVPDEQGRPTLITALPETGVTARAKRDALLTNVYDRAVAMLQRAARLDPAHGEQYAVKLAEFDAWAVALQNVPEQPGFPHTIDWPEQPTAEAL